MLDIKAVAMKSLETASEVMRVKESLEETLKSVEDAAHSVNKSLRLWGFDEQDCIGEENIEEISAAHALIKQAGKLIKKAQKMAEQAMKLANQAQKAKLANKLMNKVIELTNEANKALDEAAHIETMVGEKCSRIADETSEKSEKLGPIIRMLE